MSQVHSITINGLSANIGIDPSVMQGITAWGILFDDATGDTLAETETKHFIGYCLFDVVYLIAEDMMHTRNRIDANDIYRAILDSGIPECNCD